METKINLDQCRIEETTEEYRIQKLDTQGILLQRVFLCIILRLKRN